MMIKALLLISIIVTTIPQWIECSFPDVIVPIQGRSNTVLPLNSALLAPHNSAVLSPEHLLLIKNNDKLSSLRGGGLLSSILLNNTMEWTIKEIVYSLLAFISVTLSVLITIAGSSSNGVLVYILAGVSIITGPSAAILQTKLTTFETLRKLNNEMAKQVNDLEEQNVNLTTQTAKLQKSTKKLEQAKNSLATLVESKNMSVDELIQQVQDYKKIQTDIQVKIREEIRQTLLSVLIRTDMDQDFVLGSREIDMVCVRLKLMPNVEFNESKFRSTMKKHQGSILDFSQYHLTDLSTIQQEAIFTF